MNRFCFFLLLLTFFAGSCKKELAANRISGSYSGVFYRTSPTIRTYPATVNLSFSDSSFSGYSSHDNYPAICSGKYSIEKGRLVINNQCVFTADFDGTLIFNGRYSFEQKRSKLKIWKDYGNGTFDFYELEKEK